MPSRGIEVFQLQQRDDALCHAVYVYRVRAVVEVPWRPVLPEEVRAVKLETPAHVTLELVRPKVPAN